MALERAFNPNTRFILAFPQAFKDWTKPETAELNAKNGLVFDLTCALNQSGTTHDLGEASTNDSLTFCQVAGAVNRTDENASITWEFERSRDPLQDNTANTAFNLLRYRGIEYFAILSIGREPGEKFQVGDRIKMARVYTDYGADAFGTGENLRMSQSFASRGDVNWNYKLEK